MKSSVVKWFLPILISLALSACGGGGSSGSKGSNGISSTGTSTTSSSTSSSSSVAVVAKIDQQPLVFSEQTVNLLIDDAPFVNPLTGGSGEGVINFASDNADVATVDQTNGEVSIVGAGSATISVTKSADDIYNATTATYALTVSKYNQVPLVFEQANIQAVINAPITSNSLSGGSGSGATTYEIGDSTIASIDANSGTVSVLSPGVTSVTATRAGDGLYNSTTATYTLDVVELLSGLEILVGRTETLIEWHGQSGVVDLGRTTNSNCDIDNINRCANGRLTTITSPVQTPVVDSYIKTTTPAYLIFQNETYRSNPVNTRVPLAPFPKRRGEQIVSFQGKLWMIGGMDDQSVPSINDAIRYNDIWSSEDGISWKLEISNAAFAGRAYHQIIEYRDELYLIGGEVALGTEGATWYRSDVWKSSDGVLWQEMSAAAFAGAQSAKFIVFDDKIWAIGGGIWATPAHTGIWTTTNGTDWTLENATAPFGPREGHALYIVNNLLMVLGGMGPGGSDNLLNDVWSSPDGINWTEEVKNTSFAPRVEMKVQSLNGTLWLIGGNSYFSVHNSAYSSSDGIRWTLAATPIVSTMGQLHSLALHDNALWIYSGFEEGLIWKSYNGTTWGVPVDASTSWKLRP